MIIYMYFPAYYLSAGAVPGGVVGICDEYDVSNVPETHQFWTMRDQTKMETNGANCSYAKRQASGFMLLL